MYNYRTKGTCSSNIELEVEDGIIKDIAFWGGCNGNLKGISALVKGMKVEDAITRLEGIRCGFKHFRKSLLSSISAELCNISCFLSGGYKEIFSINPHEMELYIRCLDSSAYNFLQSLYS